MAVKQNHSPTFCDISKLLSCILIILVVVYLGSPVLKTIISDRRLWVLQWYHIFSISRDVDYTYPKVTEGCLPCQINHFLAIFAHTTPNLIQLSSCWFTWVYKNKILGQVSLKIQVTELWPEFAYWPLPVTLLLIKVEKQTLYHWKANKHAHITHKIKNSVNKNVCTQYPILLQRSPWKHWSGQIIMFRDTLSTPVYEKLHQDIALCNTNMQHNLWCINAYMNTHMHLTCHLSLACVHLYVYYSSTRCSVCTLICISIHYTSDNLFFINICVIYSITLASTIKVAQLILCSTDYLLII